MVQMWVAPRCRQSRERATVDHPNSVGARVLVDTQRTSDGSKVFQRSVRACERARGTQPTAAGM